jgi:hypothetical protein
MAEFELDPQEMNVSGEHSPLNPLDVLEAEKREEAALEGVHRALTEQEVPADVVLEDLGDYKQAERLIGTDGANDLQRLANEEPIGTTAERAEVKELQTEAAQRAELEADKAVEKFLRNGHSAADILRDLGGEDQARRIIGDVYTDLLLGSDHEVATDLSEVMADAQEYDARVALGDGVSAGELLEGLGGYDEATLIVGDKFARMLAELEIYDQTLGASEVEQQADKKGEN